MIKIQYLSLEYQHNNIFILMHYNFKIIISSSMKRTEFIFTGFKIKPLSRGISIDTGQLF